MEEAFGKVDLNKDGKIDVEEMKQVRSTDEINYFDVFSAPFVNLNLLQVLQNEAKLRGVKLSDRDMVNMFKDADLDENGEIDYKEFVIMICDK